MLSPATEAYDRMDKRLHYQRLSSLRAYVLVAHDQRRLEVWRRDGDEWSHATFGAGDRLELPSIGCHLDVDALYREAAVDVR